jgi:hypothetical protein
VAIGARPSDPGDVSEAFDAREAPSGSRLPADIETAWSKRRSEVVAEIDQVIRDIAAEALRSQVPLSGYGPGDPRALWELRRELAAEIERSEAELAALRERRTVVRRELDEAERRKASAEEEYRTWRRRIEAERRDLIARADVVARSVSELRSALALGQDEGDATTPDGASVAAPPEITREITVVVTNLPHLAEAMRVRKSIGAIPRVRSISFPRFHDGAMTITVCHAPDLDFASAAMTLPGVTLTLTRVDGDRLEYRSGGGDRSRS